MKASTSTLKTLILESGAHNPRSSQPVPRSHKAAGTAGKDKVSCREPLYLQNLAVSSTRSTPLFGRFTRCYYQAG